MKKTAKFDSTFLILAIVLIAFVASATSLSIQHTNSLIESRIHKDEWLVWQQLESYLKNSKTCTTLMKGHRRGDSLLGLEGGLRVGREWQSSGWLVKDLYLIRIEDEVAWELKQDLNHEGQFFLKVSLIPKPLKGEKLGMEYLLTANTSSRLIQIDAELVSDEMRGPASSNPIIKECK